MKKRHLVALTALAVTGTLTLSACSSSTPSPKPTATVPAPIPAPEKPANPADYKVSADLTSAPKIEVAPTARNVTKLYTANIVEGSGPAVQAGDTVTVQYTGIGALSGKTFDSSWDRGEPITFSLNQVITGWGEGLVGMQVGGRRLLVIPASQAYGNTPPTPAIAPGETLIFVVDLLAINP